MSHIQRYGPLFDILDQSNEMEPIADGNYVKFEDYQKLQEQLEKAEDVILKYKNLFGDAYGGKEARQYFKEKENP